MATTRPRAVLNEDQVREIRRAAASGTRNTDLARRYNVSEATISYIVRRFTWRHLDAETAVDPQSNVERR